MISTTSEVLEPTGGHWPWMANRDIAVITAVAASSSGIPGDQRAEPRGDRA